MANDIRMLIATTIYQQNRQNALQDELKKQLKGSGDTAKRNEIQKLYTQLEAENEKLPKHLDKVIQLAMDAEPASSKWQLNNIISFFKQALIRSGESVAPEIRREQDVSNTNKHAQSDSAEKRTDKTALSSGLYVDHMLINTPSSQAGKENQVNNSDSGQPKPK